MEFGKPPSDKELKSIDFSLPPDHTDAAKVPDGRKKEVKVYTSCGKWGRKEWSGRLIYPEGTYTPNTFDYLIEKFNEACGLNIKRPEFINT